MNVPFLIQTFWSAIKAVPITLLITGASLLIGLPLGFLLAWIKNRKIRILIRSLSHTHLSCGPRRWYY